MNYNEIDNNQFNLLFGEIRYLESVNLKTRKCTDAQMVQLIIRKIEIYVKEDQNEIYAAEDGELYEIQGN